MMRIRTQPSLSRDFTMLSLFIVFILLAVSLWVARQTHTDNGARILKQLENESLRIDRALIVEIENASYILESVGRQIASMPNTNLAGIDQLFQSFDRRDYAKNSFFSWADSSQMLVDSSVTGRLKQPIDISDRDYVKKAITKPWELHIGRPIQGRISNRWVLPLSLGITNKKGEYLGVLILSLDISSLTREISKVIKDQGIRFAITNLSLTLLTQDSADIDFFSKYFDLKSLSTLDFDSAPTGILSSPSVWDSAGIYSYYERSSEYPYIIFLGYDAKRSAESVRSALIPQISQLFAIAGFLLYVLWLVKKRIIHPVISLTQYVRKMAQGERVQLINEPGPIEIEYLEYEINRIYQYLEERRRLETELRNKNAELIKIKESARISHQVKADFYEQVGEQLAEPIAQIQAQAETLKDQHFGPLANSKYQQSATEIYGLAQQVYVVLQDIRSITEAESGLIVMHETPLNITSTLQKIVRQFREKEGQNLDIQIDTGGETIQIEADELRLRQLLLILLHECASHLSAGDMIRIHVSDKGEELHLIFGYGEKPDRDSGRNRAEAFDLSQRSPDTTSGRAHGLSIALARLLVALHEGTLETRTLPDKTFQITVRWPASRIIRD
jgi:two-component system, cell cycle sensor histidine kinase PleC